MAFCNNLANLKNIKAYSAKTIVHFDKKKLIDISERRIKIKLSAIMHFFFFEMPLKGLVMKSK